MPYVIRSIYMFVTVTYNKTIISHTTNIFTLTFRSLPETCIFIRRSLFNSSSSSCHDRDVTWQEIGRTCDSSCSCPRPGSRIVVHLSEYVPLLLSTEYFCQILCPELWQPVNWSHGYTVTCFVIRCSATTSRNPNYVASICCGFVADLL